jgi:uncharacterized protein (DUF433 family)
VVKTEKRDVAEAANWRWQDRIDIDPKIQAGKPVIKGTRVAVHVLVGSLAGGDSIREVCEGYLVTEEDVRAALAYAAMTLAKKKAHALPR